MFIYDPDTAPPPAVWLALDDDARFESVLAVHTRRVDALHPEGLDAAMHSRLHIVIETQLATGTPAATASTLARLQSDGLRRHAGIHLLSAALAQAMAETMRLGGWDDDRWAARLDAIDAGAWVGDQVSRRFDD
ncbi:MAG: hypothetical protein ACI8PZ_006764 [Myxococcota bacterium]|jgi:hypothetical protein